MLLNEIIFAIESFAPLAYQADWDHSGWQVASANTEISTLAVFLDPTPPVIEAALAKGADLMLSHHPLGLKPRFPDKLDSYYEILQLLLGADVGLYAAHTSLDVNPAGPASWLGHSLGLHDIEILDPLGNAPQFGYGGIGELQSAVPIRDLIDKVLALTKLKGAIISGYSPELMIRKVAWCAGSGGSMISQAQNLGAEIYITGDIKYHDALSAQLPILDVGHHSLEEEMMARFAIMLQERMADLNIIFIPSKSPFKIVDRRAGS